MNKLKKISVILALIIVVLGVVAGTMTVSAASNGAEDTAPAVTSESAPAQADNTTGFKAVAAAVAVGLAALGGAIAMGMAVSKSAEGISRQPEAEGKIRTTLMLGLVFIETAIIYALIVAILIIFVM